jgi:hypothetical protein
MASLPPTLDFSKMEESICEKWEKEETFKAQDRLSIERKDEVRLNGRLEGEKQCSSSQPLFLSFL